jgi:hypothetical protein
MSKKPVRVVVVEEPEGRFVVSTLSDGEVTRVLVDPDKKPTRRPRRPHIKAKIKDHTRRKRF